MSLADLCRFEQGREIDSVAERTDFDWGLLQQRESDQQNLVAAGEPNLNRMSCSCGFELILIAGSFAGFDWQSLSCCNLNWNCTAIDYR